MTDLNRLSAQEIIDRFNMVPLGGEGGYWSPITRNASGNSISYLLASPDFSALHRLMEDELWIYVAGAPADLIAINEHVEKIRLGLDGEPWRLIPAHTWMGMELTGDWTLVVCALAPPFSSMELADVERGDALAKQFPEHSELIRRLIRV